MNKELRQTSMTAKTILRKAQHGAGDERADAAVANGLFQRNRAIAGPAHMGTFVTIAKHI
jgi:hypothetical protein